MKTVTDSHPTSGEDTVTTADLVAKGAEIQGTAQAPAGHDPVSQTPAEAYAEVARIFREAGLRSEQLREAELVFSWATPVAATMRALEAGDAADGAR